MIRKHDMTLKVAYGQIIMSPTPTLVVSNEEVSLDFLAF